jgi:hypothetical protein
VDKENAKLFDWAFSKLTEYYQAKSPQLLPQLKVLQNMMNKDSS